MEKYLPDLNRSAAECSDETVALQDRFDRLLAES